VERWEAVSELKNLGELKSLVEIGLLIEQVGNAPLSFLAEVDESLARQVAEIRDWLARGLAEWKGLPAEAKLALRVEELAKQVNWRRSRYDNECEFVYVDEARELKELLEKCENGKIETGGFAYYLRGNVIKRYPRGNRKAAQQAASQKPAPQTAPQASQQAPQGGGGK
jgi:hypothetical protein